MSDQSPKRLSGDQVKEVLALVKGADTVELKVTIPDHARGSAVEALGMDPLEASMRQVWFFDTPDLALQDAGVVVRARRTQGRVDDSVVKLRPVEPDHMPADLRKVGEFGVEVDAMPGGFVCSASFKGKLGEDDVRGAISGAASVESLFSRGQRDFYAEHAPQGVGMADLQPLGPVNVLKLKFSPEGYARKLVAELWFYPDGSRILELSTKCKPGEEFQVAAETRAFLEGHGLDLDGEQATKTRTALEAFSQELAAR